MNRYAKNSITAALFLIVCIMFFSLHKPEPLEAREVNGFSNIRESISVEASDGREASSAILKGKELPSEPPAEKKPESKPSLEPAKEVKEEKESPKEVKEKKSKEPDKQEESKKEETKAKPKEEAQDKTEESSQKKEEKPAEEKTPATEKQEEKKEDKPVDPSGKVERKVITPKPLTPVPRPKPDAQTPVKQQEKKEDSPAVKPVPKPAAKPDDTKTEPEVKPTPAPKETPSDSQLKPVPRPKPPVDTEVKPVPRPSEPPVEIEVKPETKQEEKPIEPESKPVPEPAAAPIEPILEPEADPVTPQEMPVEPEREHDVIKPEEFTVKPEHGIAPEPPAPLKTYEPTTHWDAFARTVRFTVQQETQLKGLLTNERGRILNARKDHIKVIHRILTPQQRQEWETIFQNADKQGEIGEIRKRQLLDPEYLKARFTLDENQRRHLFYASWNHARRIEKIRKETSAKIAAILNPTQLYRWEAAVRLRLGTQISF